MSNHVECGCRLHAQYLTIKWVYIFCFFFFREREKERRRDDDMMVLFPCCPRVCDTTNVNATQQQCFVICVATDLIREAKGSKCNLEI